MSAKPKKENNIKINFGIWRHGTTSSSKLFFFYVDHMGYEMGINKCVHARRIGSRQNTPYNNEEWNTSAEYTLKQPIILKMSNYCTEFGRRKQRAQIYLNIDGTGEKIQLTGLNGVGGIEFRGNVDFERSGITEEALIKDFGYSIVAPAFVGLVEKNGIRPRRIIYE